MTVDQEKINAIVTATDSRYIKKEAGKGLSTNDYTNAEKTKLAGLVNITIDSSLSDTSTNPVQNKIIENALNSKADSSSLSDVATSGDYDDLINAPNLSELGGVVTVEQQVTAEEGFITTYVVKQNGVQVGSKINVPKDFLVRSATVETASDDDTPVIGYAAGDRYIDFVINTIDNDETNEHLYLLVSDLISEYTADNTTLQLTNNQFSVKDEGITLSKLSSDVQASLAKADNWNSSLAKTITQNDIDSWNGKSELTTSDVDDEIEDYMAALIEALNS